MSHVTVAKYLFYQYQSSINDNGVRHFRLASVYHRYVYEGKNLGIAIEKDRTDSCQNCNDRQEKKLEMPWLRGLLKI